MDSIRKAKKSKIELTDRISDMPDSILCKILSHLPTKNVVATCILSSRWKNLFPFGVLPIYLDLDDSLLLHPTKIECNSTTSTSFSDFVDKLLNTTLRGVPRVETMRLYYDSYDDGVNGRILSWVSAALRLRVRELELCVNIPDMDALFHSLNGCTTLVTLVLNLEKMDVSFPDNLSLPNLKSAEFVDLFIDDWRKDSIEDFLDGCPALEDLSVIGYIWDFRIQSLTLKNLTIVNTTDDDDPTHRFDLDTPNLQVLVCNCDAARICRVSGFKSLFTAHIDIWPSETHFADLADDYDFDDDAHDVWFVDEGISDVVTACSSVVHLYLGTCSIDALHISCRRLPTFQNLTRLGLGYLSWRGYAMVPRLLSSAPNLKELNFEEGCRKDEGVYEDCILWSGPSLICLEFHLEKIEFSVFHWTDDEIYLLEYFLRDGKVIEKIILHCRRSMDISIVNTLRMLPNQSKVVLEPI